MEIPKTCGSCGKKGAVLKCPCMAVCYCEAECQKAAWKEHRQVCTVDMVKKIEKEKAKVGPDDVSIGKAAFTLGCLLKDRNKLDEGKEWLLESLRIFKIGYGENHANVVAALSNLGSLAQKQGDMDTMLAMYKQTLRIIPKIFGNKSKQMALSLMSIGTAHSGQGQYDLAMAKFKEALSMHKKLSGEDNKDVLMVLNNMSIVLEKQGKHDEALKMKEKAVEAQRSHLSGGDSDQAAIALLELGVSYSKRNMFAEARVKCEECLAMVRRLHPEKHAIEGRILHQMGQLASDQGLYQEALQLHIQAAANYKDTKGPNSADYGQVLSMIGTVLGTMGLYSEAVERYEEAVEVKRKAFGDCHIEVANTLRNIAVCRGQTGDTEDAAQDLKQAHAIYTKVGATSENAQQVAALVEEMEKNVEWSRTWAAAMQSAMAEGIHWEPEMRYDDDDDDNDHAH